MGKNIFRSPRRLPLPAALARLPLSAVAASRGKAVLRSAAYFAVVASAIAGLILALPVRRYYASADYDLARFDLEVNGFLNSRQLDYLGSVSAKGSLVTYVYLAPVDARAKGHGASPAFVYLTTEPSRIGESWFSDAAVVSGGGDTGPDWFDISAGMAQELGVSPGDEISIPIMDQNLKGRVRRILAIERSQMPLVAVGELTPAFRANLATLEGGIEPSVATLRSSATPSNVAAELNRLGGKGGVTVLTRQQGIVANDGAGGPVGTPMMLVLLVLGFGLLLAVSAREGIALIRRRVVDLAVILAVGGSRRQILTSVAILEGAGMTAGLAVAFWLVKNVIYRYLFAPAFPPTFEIPVLLSLIVAGIAYVAALVFAAGVRLRSANIVRTLSVQQVH